MAKIKNRLVILCTPEYVAALKKHIDAVNESTSMADYVREAIEARVIQEGGSLPRAVAPWGVRNDALPVGWKSRFSPEKYQLQAVYHPGEGFMIEHLHKASPVLDSPYYGLLYFDDIAPGDGRTCEIAVYCSQIFDKRDVEKALQLALLEHIDRLGL